MATVSRGNTNVISITTLTTFPAPSSSATGTITVAAASKEIVGVGTNFKTFKEGDWIIDTTNFETRKISRILGDLYCIVDFPFSNALSGVTLVITPSSRVVYADFYAASGGKINNVTVPNGVVYPLATVANTANEGLNNFIDPVIVDGTGGAVFISWRI